MMNSRLTNLTRIYLYSISTNGYCTIHHNHRLTDFPAVYDSKAIKSGWNETSEKNECFSLRKDSREIFKMILPPPNITGVLHLGHALTVTIQDILARWHRMNGDSVVWIPGLDHAGIATQAVIEKSLMKKQGISRYDLGREKFVSLVWEWKREKAEVIVDQLKALGASLDWSKEYFTMDKHHNVAVTEMFILLKERNLLYRDKGMINWSPALNSALSDIEVNTLEISEKTDLQLPGYKRKVRFGQIYEIAYPVKDTDQQLVVATTRPETVFGDVALAVHPEDERYAKYIGKHVWHPIRETFIPIVCDPAVDRSFGTGIVKITPAHNHFDYDIAKKYQLEIINIIDDSGKIINASENYQGLRRFEAREKVLDQLASEGLLKNVRDHKMVLPMCSRSDDIIEYLLREQWFVNCKDMANKAMEAVRNGDLKIYPSSYEEVWYDKLGTIRDWCISRQLWWGHRIPAYYIDLENNKKEWIVARSKEEALNIAYKKYGNDVKLHQDEDVLDTWFSSALLPLTVAGWPTEKLDRNWPLTLIETGHDIFFFWVARMVMFSLEVTNRLPFKEILLHGVLCDNRGRKMSKSFGNVVSPEDIINGITLDELNAQTKQRYEMGLLNKDELKRTLNINKSRFPNGVENCGTDALRMTLCSQSIKGNTISFDIDTCITNKRFCNKIWQASKYVLLMAVDDCHERPQTLAIVDHWILSRLSLMVQKVNEAFEHYEFHRAVESIKQFLYYEFCDFYVESTKWGFRSENVDTIRGHSYTLIKCLEVSLRILSPIMPYLADDLYLRLTEKLPGFSSAKSLKKTSFPLFIEYEKLRNPYLDGKIAEIVQLIQEIRGVTANVSKKLISEVHIVVDNNTDASFYTENLNLIKGGARIFDTFVYSKHDYDVNTDYVKMDCDITGVECSLFVKAKDSSALKHMKSNIDRRKSQKEQELKVENVKNVEEMRPAKIQK